MSGINGKAPASAPSGPPKEAPDRDRQDESHLRAHDSRSSRILVGLLLVLGALAYRDLLFWDPANPGLPATGWFFFRVSETAPQILFLVAIPLLCRRRKRIAHALHGEAASWLALPFLALGAALFVWGYHANALDLVLASLLAVTLGAALLLSGRRLASELMLLLLFLAFAIPLPAVLTNQLVYPLQLSTALHTGWLLHAIGIPAIQEGDMLHLTSSSFEVIETCSGLRSIFVITPLAVGWLCFFPTRRLTTALVILSAPVIAYFVNTLRVLSLVLNSGSDLRVTHAVQGVTVFVTGFLILYAFDSLLRRMLGGSETPIGEPETDAPLHNAWERYRSAIALAFALAIMVGVSFWGPRWNPPDTPRRPSVDLPREIDGWKVAGKSKPDSFFLGSVGFRKRWYREYERDDERVSVFIGYDDRLDRNRSLLSPKNAVPDAGWHVEERTPIQLAPSGPRAESVSARSGTTRTLSIHWYEGTDPLALEILRAGLATDQSSLRRPGGAWVVRLSTDIAQTRDGEDRAEARLRGFAEVLGPRVERSRARKTKPRLNRPKRSGG